MTELKELIFREKTLNIKLRRYFFFSDQAETINVSRVQEKNPVISIYTTYVYN